MTQTVEERILKMLEHTIVGQRGLPVKKVSFFTTWNGYDVYNFYLDVKEPIEMGPPWFYLVKNDEITVTTFKQALKIMVKHSRESGGRDEYDEEWKIEEEQESVPEPVPYAIGSRI